jgi:hypothetical protein
MPYRVSGSVVMFLICLLTLLVASRPATAEVTWIEFASKQQYGTFRSGEYLMWQGRIHGDLSPQEAIPGIDKAVRNGRDRVAYSAKIILIMPANRGGNGALLVDIPNRGRDENVHAIEYAPAAQHIEAIQQEGLQEPSVLGLAAR